MKRRRNPYVNTYYCEKTPHKARYLKAAFAWEVGATQVKKSGVALFVYRCEGCDGWHLTKKEGDGTQRIETKASPVRGTETAKDVTRG